MAAIASAADGNYSAGATWVGGVPPTLADDATLNHIVTLDVNANVKSVVIGTGVLVGTNPNYRLLVGSGGRPGFIVKAVVL